MNPSSKIADFCSRLLDLLLLNLLFILTSVPIVTIGPALCALYSVTLKMVCDEDSHLIRSYFHAFRINFRKALPVSMAFLLMFLLLLADLWIALTTPGAFYLAIGIFSMFLLVLLLTAVTYFFPILARFQFTTRQVFQNMLHMIASSPGTVFALAVLNAPVVFFLCYSVYTAAAAAAFLMMIGFAAIGYVQSFLLRKLFRPYEQGQ